MDIFQNQTSDTVTDAVRLTSGHESVFCWGVFDGATVKLQLCPVDPEQPNADWFDYDEATFTEKSSVNGAIGGNIWVRGVVEDAGLGTSVNLVLRTVSQYAFKF